MSKENEFYEILKSVMESERPPGNVHPTNIDWLVMEDYIRESGNRVFHVTERGAMYYTELFLRLERLRGNK